MKPTVSRLALTLPVVWLLVDAISNRSNALVQGCLLAIGLTYLLVNFMTDVAYRWISRRVRG
jgi:peptide/nickel transport system permease protein